MSDQLDRLKLKELAEYTAFRCVPENRNLNTLKCKYCGRSWWFEHRTMEICSVRGENHIRTIRTALPALIAENERLEERNDWVETQYAAVQQERDKAELACKRLEGELAEARKERDLIGGRHNKRANTAEAERDEARKRCETLEAALQYILETRTLCNSDKCADRNHDLPSCPYGKARAALASEQEGKS